MRVFDTTETDAHAPAFFLMRGRVVANEERPPRAERLRAAVAALGLASEAPPQCAGDGLRAVHSARYLSFLKEAHAAWGGLSGAGPEVLGNVQPRVDHARYPAGIVGRAGWHLGDLACPIGPATYAAACRAADCAVAAANVAAAGGDAYALARPPGHHAAAEIAGGHCFLNNAAAAAAAIAAGGLAPAIIDIDVHHGNGTQAIFWRDPTPFISIHADPHHFYPWFVGHAAEVGEGEGEGATHNLPLPLGADDAAFLAAIDTALERLDQHRPDVVVLSLGLDVHERDPLAGMRVTTDGIRRAGAAIGALRQPVAIVQEGGYLSEDLTANAVAFFEGFLGARR